MVAFLLLLSATASIGVPAFAGAMQMAVLHVSASAAPVTAYIVNSLDDTNDGSCDLSHCSLREAITLANSTASPARISFSVSGVITLTSGLPPISDTLTIDGNGQSVTISGGNAYQVMYVNSGTALTLNALTIANGFSPVGGGIENCGTLTVTNSAFSDNWALISGHGYGGGIANWGTLTVMSTTVSGNRAGSTGGGTPQVTICGFTAQFPTSGAGIENYGTLTAVNSAFTGNSSYGGGGGIDNDGGTLTVVDSTFSGNDGFSGGIHDRGALTVTHSVFSGNSANGGGGGITVELGPASVVSSTFAGNSTVNTGGGIYNHDAALTVTDSTFSGNSAQLGGGIDSGATTGGGILSVMNSTFFDNIGGGISNGGTLTVINGTFSGNSAGGPGGGGILNDGTSTVMNSTFTGNSASGFGSSGGGIYNGDTLNISNSTFSGNSASGPADFTGNGGTGGGIYNANTLSISNSTFSGNTALIIGGGIYNPIFGRLDIDNSTFSDNYAVLGGSIDNNGGTLTLRNTIVANNSSYGQDCDGTITNGGNNLDSGTSCGWGSDNGSLSNTDPRLGPLVDNGGSTQTMALLPGSPAIDGVIFNAPDGCPATDQRGVKRPIGPRCDIGAYEYEPGISFLPLVARNFVAAPDLIVKSIVASSHAVTVVISNIGSASVVNEFWVDLYVNPRPAPTGVNQVWNDGRSRQGVVWGITAPALPMQPGAVLTLTLSSPYYWVNLSHLVNISPNTPIYAQVDSANTDTTYGAVLEAHEIVGGPYNNILGPVLSSLGMAGQTPATLLDQQRSRFDRLPHRPGR
jgi:CSLREA domain-containing protein